MTVLVLGASGFLGGNIARRLRDSGHAVTGLVRSDSSARVLHDQGIPALTGDLELGLDAVIDRARGFDTVIFAPQLLLEPEHQAVSTLLDAFAGSGKTFVFTSGTGVLGQRTFGAFSIDSFAESDAFTPAKPLVRRVETERLVQASAARGVRGIVVRPPLVWGPGDHGHIAMVYESVAKTGAACYIGPGLNCYTNVHIDDLTDLFARVVERGVAGALYHAANGEIPNRWIAESVARDLGVATRSLSVDEAFEVFGKFRTLIVLGASSRSRSPRSRDELGWAPPPRDMLSLIGEPRLRALAVPVSQPAPVAPA